MSPPDPGTVFVEDLEVGQRRCGAPRTVGHDEIAACAAACGVDRDADEAAAASAEVQQLLGARLRAEQLTALTLPTASAGLPSTVTWTVRRPVSAADGVRLETVITRCRRAHGEATGRVNLHARLVDHDGAVRHEGVVSTRLAARPGSDPPGPDRDFGSPAWGAALAERLAGHPAFGEATRTFDGSIELEAGQDRVQLRVYRGDVLAASRSTPLGPTFTVAGEELAWVELAEAPRNEFVKRAMQGRFRARGNTHEYLRLTKAVVTLCDAVRELAALDGRSSS